MKTKLKLYVWTNYSPDYTSGLAFAVATSETHARELIEAERGLQVYNWGDLEVRPLNEPVAYEVSGGS